MRGADVHRLQVGINRRRAARGKSPIRVDGLFDSVTLRAYREAADWIGLPAGHPPTRTAQLNIRRPWTRTPAARRRAKRRKRGAARPRILTARQLGLAFVWVFGPKGYVYRGAGHYTGGHRAPDAAALAVEVRADHRYHAGKGWGGLAYEAMVADDGTIALGNPMGRKAAAVAGQNTGMVGICSPGTTGDRMTAAQRASIRWLLDHWHTSAIPKEHRLPRPARQLDWRGHREFPGQATACPGDMLTTYKELFR